MIRFLLIHSFYPKKKMILFVSCCILTLFLGFLVYPDQTVTEQLLFQNDLNTYYHQMMGKTIKLVMPFLVILCVMDHDQAYLKPMMTYLGRSPVIKAKLLMYPLILLILYLFIVMIYHLLPFFLTSYYRLNDLKISFFIHLYLDGVMLTLGILWIIKDKYKAFSILFSLFYLLMGFIQEDVSIILLYALFPFENQLFDTYSLAYLYKICYITLGLTLIHHKLINETLK
jgi:hypothetical protein